MAKMTQFWGKKQEKQCYHNDIYRGKRDTYSSEAKIRRGIVWIKKTLKKANEFNWGKSQD